MCGGKSVGVCVCVLRIIMSSFVSFLPGCCVECSSHSTKHHHQRTHAHTGIVFSFFKE